MTTSLDIVKRSMRLVGALGGGETPTADEAKDGLDALNSMLDQWWIQRLAVYRIEQQQFTWPSGQISRTIGPTGNLTLDPRPIKIQSARQLFNDVDYPIPILTEEQYRAIPLKTTTSTLITDLYYDPTLPNGTIFIYPVVSTNVTLRLSLWTQLQNFASLTTQLALPPGYKEAIEFNLAVTIAPEYERTVPDWVSRKAMISFKHVKRFNHQTPRSIVEPGLMKDPPYFDWRSGNA